MSKDDFEYEVRGIADYLGCNADELVSEMLNLASKMCYEFYSPKPQSKSNKGEVEQ